MARSSFEAMVIGGSAGGLEALTTILPALPSSFVTPILVVLHVPPDKTSRLAEVLAGKCVLHSKEAEDKEPIRPATLYVAPPNYHLLVEKARSLALSVDDPVHYSRPAIDVLFESAADAFGSSLLGVLLTGASEDGARGLHAIRRAGGRTIVQDPSTAAARTMPQAALKFCPDHEVLPLAEIGPALAKLAVKPESTGTRA